MRAAGVFADVASDGAGSLAGGVRSIEISVGFDGQVWVGFSEAGLDDGSVVREVDLKNAIQGGEGDHEPARGGDRPAAEAGSSASARDRNVVLARKFDECDYF